jgi:formylglycine-generating enzyme required for sulfatase activity/tRNA A-37 threonylcarbamoyl transferase component Bud32
VIGERIKDFEIIAPLGRGGMGEVFVATQAIVKTTVAIKLLREDISSDQQHVQRFFNEAVAASKIQHAGIVHIFDVGFHGRRAYLIMEHLAGESLSARMRRAPRLAREEIFDIAAQLASVLQATHTAGITHRDLKPDNVFLVPDQELASKRRVKVLDFGIAKLAPAAGADATALTLSNASMGTPGYMAPEQWRDAAGADARADVYSLGCVVFELCCGRPPFVATSIAEACTKHLTEIAPRLRSLAPELSQELDDVVARMLEKDPTARPTIAHVARVLADLRESRQGALVNTALAAPAAPRASTPSIAVGAPITDRPAPPATAPGPAAAAVTTEPPRSTHVVVIPVAIAVAVLAVVLAGIAIYRGGRPADVPSVPATRGSTTVTQAPPAPSEECGDMARVPGGVFQMGNEEHDDAAPRHRVTVSPFCIDRTEVTVAAYRACVETGKCTIAPTTVSNPTWNPDKATKWSTFCNGDRRDRNDHPINCVDWDQAATYCAALGKRLPREAEWEWAAGAADGRRYPWGDDAPNATRLNATGTEARAFVKQLGWEWQVKFEADDGWALTAPVGSYPAGASPYGVLDLAGNVSEWIADWHGPYSTEPQTDPVGPASGSERVVRGSAWVSFKLSEDWIFARAWDAPTARLPHIGFRCARAFGR